MITLREFKKQNPSRQKALMKEYSDKHANFASKKLRSQKYELATIYFEQALALKPEPNIMLQQGEAYEYLFKYDQAFACINRAANQRNFNGVLKRINYTKQYSIAEAKEYVRTMLPHFKMLWFEYRKYGFISQDYQISFDNDEQFLVYMNANNNHIDIDNKQKKELLQYFYISGHQLNAFQWISSLTLIDTKYPYYLYQCAILLMRHSRVEEAMLCLNYLISKDNRNVEYYILLARIKCLNQQNLQASLSLLKQCLLNNLELIFNEILQLLSYAGDNQMIKDNMETYIIYFENQMQVLCETLFKLEDYKSLIEFIVDFRNQNGSQYYLFDGLAKCFFELRVYYRFLENCDLMIQNDHHSITPYIYKCKYYLRECNLSLFLQNFQIAIALQPSNTDLHYLKLEYYKFIRNTEGVLSTIEQINALDSKLSIIQIMSTHLFDYKLESDMQLDCLKKERIIQISILENGLNNINFYQLKILQQWQYYIENYSFEFLTYLLHLKLIIIGFCFDLFQDVFTYYLEDQFDNLQLEYPEYQNFYNYVQSQFKFKKIELFSRSEQQRYIFEYELGLVSEYHFQKVKLNQQPLMNTLNKYKLQDYFSKSKEANYAIQDGMAIFQEIKSKKINFFLKQDYKTDILEALGY